MFSPAFHSKEKVDAGADFVLTQFFYDTQMFINFLERCRAANITCPIIPGTMKDGYCITIDNS